MISDERLDEYIALYEEKFGKKLSRAEAYDGAQSLIDLVKILYDGAATEHRRQLKLKNNPKGFHLDGAGYTCFICGCSASHEETWYDKYGIKCMVCQKAIDRREIPPSLAKDKDSWYSKHDLESYFNLKAPTVRKWVKDGILKVRTVTNDGHGVRVQLFLIKDNKDFLPPKKLVEGHHIKEVRDDGDWYHTEPWYKFVDPHKHLKGYKIMDYLRVVTAEEAKLNGTPSIP